MPAEETNASPPTGNTTPSGNITAASAYARGQVEDALSLCGYAVAAGVHSPRGEPQLFADIAVIHGTAARLGMFEAPGGGASSGSVTTPEWVGFEQAYYRLAAALSPVTATRSTPTTRANSARALKLGLFLLFESGLAAGSVVGSISASKRGFMAP